MENRKKRCSVPDGARSVSFDIFMDIYFTSFRLLTLLGANNIGATHVLNKSRLRNCTIIGDKQLQKRKERSHFKQRTSTKKQCNFDSGWLEQLQGGLHNFFWILCT